MHLLPEPLFSIQTDCVHIVSITGGENGRIFMAGKDGCLYELHYQVSIYNIIGMGLPLLVFVVIDYVNRRLMLSLYRGDCP